MAMGRRGEIGTGGNGFTKVRLRVEKKSPNLAVLGISVSTYLSTNVVVGEAVAVLSPCRIRNPEPIILGISLARPFVLQIVLFCNRFYLLYLNLTVLFSSIAIINATSTC